MSIKLLVVDDHPVVRLGVRAVISRQADLVVVGEAGDGAAAVKKAEELAPDVVVVDIQMAGMDGIEASRRILARLPHTKVMILSEYAEPNLLNRVLEAGIRGYLLKTNPSEEILLAIRAVMAGHSYLCAEASTLLVTEYMDRLDPKESALRPLLSEREREVLKLTAEGLRTKEIAERMDIGVRTVETYRSRLMKKVGCRGNVELTRYAMRGGVVS